MTWVIVGFWAKNGGLDFSKPPLNQIGALIRLLYDGFFLLPSSGRLLHLFYTNYFVIFVNRLDIDATSIC